MDYVLISTSIILGVLVVVGYELLVSANQRQVVRRVRGSVVKVKGQPHLQIPSYEDLIPIRTVGLFCEREKLFAELEETLIAYPRSLLPWRRRFKVRQQQVKISEESCIL